MATMELRLGKGSFFVKSRLQRYPQEDDVWEAGFQPIADTLIEIADKVGLPKDEAREVLDSRRFKEAVDADWQRSRELGLTGVPTFVAGDRAVVGAQPYEVLEKLVVEAGAKVRH